MSNDANITLVMDKERLDAEFRHFTRMLAEYGQFLDSLDFQGDWQAELVHLLQTHYVLLSRTKTSLRTIELVSALMHRVLNQLGVENFRFSLPETGDSGDTAPESADPAQGNMTQQTELDHLFARLTGLMRSAPLMMQEKLRLLLVTTLRLFKALENNDAQGVDESMAKINLLTTNRHSQSLLREIAIVTRDIYNAFNALSDDLSLDSLSQSSGGVSDAVRKIQSVIIRLEAAAAQDMDNLDLLTAGVARHQQDLDGVITALRQSQDTLMHLKEKEPALEKVLTRIQDRLSDEVGANAMALRYQAQSNAHTYQELVSNLAFHDMTSQTLRKIITFVESLEHDLYDLLKKYKPILEIEHPLPTPKAVPETEEQTQDDVDKLLMDLGF